MSPAQGWDASGQEASSTSSSDALRDRYVERTLEKILRLQRQPATRPMDVVIASLLVVVMCVVILRTGGHSGPVASSDKALQEVSQRLDKLSAQQEQLRTQVSELKALEHDIAALEARPPVAMLPPPVVATPSARPHLTPPLPSPAVLKLGTAKVPPPNAGTTSAGDKVHVLQPGESLWSISEKYYGDSHLLNALAHYNGIDDPGGMQVGMSIKIPPIARLKAHPSASPAPAAQTTKPGGRD